jgi:hypothetical protein
MCGRYTLTSSDDIAARFGLGLRGNPAMQPSSDGWMY